MWLFSGKLLFAMVTSSRNLSFERTGRRVVCGFVAKANGIVVVYVDVGCVTAVIMIGHYDLLRTELKRSSEGMFP